MNRRNFIITSSIGLAAIVAERNAFSQSSKMRLMQQSGNQTDLNSIPNFLKLSDNVWTGGQPPLETLPLLKASGIKTIINLRVHSEYNGAEEEAKAKELGLRYINIPVVYNQPKNEDATEFLRVTDEQLKNGPVFLHCTAAIRAGAFWMIRRMLRDGWSYDQALEEANRIGLRNRQHLIDFAKQYVEQHQKKK